MVLAIGKGAGREQKHFLDGKIAYLRDSLLLVFIGESQQDIAWWLANFGKHTRIALAGIASRVQNMEWAEDFLILGRPSLSGLLALFVIRAGSKSSCSRVNQGPWVSLDRPRSPKAVDRGCNLAQKTNRSKKLALLTELLECEYTME